MTAIRGGVSDLERLLTGHYFRPAAVQREFQWGAEQCAALLADFERAWRYKLSDLGNTPETEAANGREQRLAEQEGVVLRNQSSTGSTETVYYLGSFVLRPSGENQFEVFDGLQRLTTLTIFFAVIRDLLDGMVPAMHERLARMVHDEADQPHLSLGSADQTLANLVQARSEAIRSRRNLAANTLRGRLLSAAGFFASRLRDLSPQELADFADFVLTHVQVGVVEVADERLARQIFITTNNRGVPLNEPDVLKSQINSIAFRQDVADKVLSSWNRVRASFDADDDYTAFLYAVDFLTRRQGRGSDGLTGLGEHLASELDDAGILNWLVLYEDKAKVWHWLNAIRSDPRRNDPTGGHIFRLFAFDWPEWRPAALELGDQLLVAVGSRDKRRIKTLAKRFEGLHRACAAVTLAEMTESSRVRLFVRALTDIASDRNPARHALVLSENAFTAISNVLAAPAYDEVMARQALRYLESVQAKILSEDILSAELQRVLPAQCAEFSDWEKAFPDSEQRWQMAHAWGNLVLRVPGRADEGSPESFREWRRAAGRDSPRPALLSPALKMSDWTPEVVASRSRAFRAEMLKLVQASE